MTVISRRRFIKRSGVAAAGFALPGIGYASPNHKPLFASAYMDANGHYYIGLINRTGQLSLQHKVPSRGHSACASYNGRYMAFMARRPRRWLAVIDTINQRVIAQRQSIAGRHYYGHAVFSHDNSFLYTTENDYESGQGKIGIYDVNNQLHRVAEIPSFGIGPHELGLLSDGKTLVVANGGIQTHPDVGRIKLNLDTMASSLTYIDIASAKELESYQVANQKLSLRHMAITTNDKVVIGAQLQPTGQTGSPLLYTHQGEATLSPLEGHPMPQRALSENYIASVAVSPKSQFAISTAPRDGKVSVWDLSDHQWLYDVDIPDVAGACCVANQPRALLSTGVGELYELDIRSGKLQRVSKHTNIHWDNHLTSHRLSG